MELQITSIVPTKTGNFCQLFISPNYCIIKSTPKRYLFS